MSYLNRTLLAKLGWKILTDEDLLLVKALKNKYLKNSNLLDAPYHPQASWTIFRVFPQRVVQARAELNRIQGAVRQQLDSTLCNEEARLVKVYADLSRPESFLKQKSRVQWLNLADLNTKFSLEQFWEAIMLEVKQVTVSQSSTKAEYKALSSATSELLWILYLLHDLGVAPSSGLWKGILKTSRLVKKGVCFTISKGQNLNILQSFKPTSNPNLTSLPTLHISDLIDADSRL
jgi:hypothetical protein